MRRLIRSVALVGTVLALGACQKKEEAKNAAMSQDMVKAIAQGKPAEVKTLLDKGEAVDAKQGGQTALHMAAMNGKVDIISVLIARGAQVDAKDDNNSTPLMMAAMGGQLDAVKALLAQGAKIEAQNKLGENALHIAGAHGRMEVVKELIDRGANVKAATNNGLDVLVFALNRKVQPGATGADTALVAYLLEKYGVGADTVKPSIPLEMQAMPEEPAKGKKK
ncbi:MAG TPA: ankyrin repeat domain-containing protein [Fibrobacteria bacterium]|nr:ankyrin repeat domain-containing protein [Fibrobacteria bacterium]